ncbi:hypothetical protein GQ54DRAFT_310783 [Martensiomyces pterosporus]|nr:hypothetical protein GQ54DRAFT_310783 [Martensiomyces pterosporus]
MSENRPVVHSEALRLSARARLNETFHKQKTAATNKRKGALSVQSPNTLNHTAPQVLGAEKEAKKLARGGDDGPISLDINNPFSADTFTTNPQTEMDKKLSAKASSLSDNQQQQQQRGKAGGEDSGASPESTRPSKPNASSPQNAGQQEVALLMARAKKSETEVITLRHQLLETKSELKAAEDRLREKDALIKEQESRIDELIETRVPQDDMDGVIADNKRLAQELRENEALLAECQRLLEEYVAADEAN